MVRFPRSNPRAPSLVFVRQSLIATLPASMGSAALTATFAMAFSADKEGHLDSSAWKLKRCFHEAIVLKLEEPNGSDPSGSGIEAVCAATMGSTNPILYSTAHSGLRS